MNLKRIPFGRGNYCVSDEGEIYNSDTGLKMKKKKAKSGYEEITLCDSGYSKSFFWFTDSYRVLFCLQREKK